MTEDQFARFVNYAEGRFQELATLVKNEVGSLREETREEIRSLREEIGALREETRGEIRSLREETRSLRVEMRERFEIVHDRLVALEKGQQALTAEVARLRAQVDELRARVDILDANTTKHIIDLKQDMQQRFRLVNERLSALEQRLAA